MGFFDGKADTAFDKMFDFNRDGNLNSTERAMQFMFMDAITQEQNQDNLANTEYDSNGFSGSFRDSTDCGFVSNSDLDFDELADMDENDRRDALEEAGYDPDDFDDEA